MNITEVKNLELTDADFSLIIKGLDNLTSNEESMKREVAMSVMESMMPDGMKERFKADMQKRITKDKLEKETMAEDIKILQGKLLMFKRWLASEGALKQTNEILGR